MRMMKNLMALIITFGVAASAIAADTFSLVVTTPDDVKNYSDGKISLREAIAYAAADTNGSHCVDGKFTITFDPAVFTSAKNSIITLSSKLTLEINDFISGRELVIDGKISDTLNVTLDGGDKYNGTTVTNHSGCQIFSVEANNIVTLENLTFRNGYHTSGGAIYNYGDLLTIKNSMFSGNSANYGGAIDNSSSATAVVSRVTFRGNSADCGGAIYNTVHAMLTVDNCTFSGNSANYGGAIDNRSVATAVNSTFSGNSANYCGGAIYDGDEMVNLLNCISVGNTAPEGGDIFTAEDNRTYTFAYCCLIGNAVKGNSTGTSAMIAYNSSVFNVAVADVFAEIANSNAVLNADGTFRILDNAVTRSGTKLAVSGTAVQYYNKAKGRFDSPFTYTYTETPLSLRAHTLTNAMLITEMLQIDQLGASRLANDAQKIYYAGR